MYNTYSNSRIPAGTFKLSRAVRRDTGQRSTVKFLGLLFFFLALAASATGFWLTRTITITSGDDDTIIAYILLTWAVIVFCTGVIIILIDAVYDEIVKRLPLPPK